MHCDELWVLSHYIHLASRTSSIIINHHHHDEWMITPCSIMYGINNIQCLESILSIMILLQWSPPRKLSTMTYSELVLPQRSQHSFGTTIAAVPVVYSASYPAYSPLAAFTRLMILFNSSICSNSCRLDCSSRAPRIRLFSSIFLCLISSLSSFRIILSVLFASAFKLPTAASEDSLIAAAEGGSRSFPYRRMILLLRSCTRDHSSDAAADTADVALLL